MTARQAVRLAAMADCKLQPHQVRVIEDLEGKLRRHVAAFLGLPVERIGPSTRFVEDLGLEVLRALEIVLSLEALLEVQLPDPEAAQVNSVGDFLDGLSRAAFRFAQC